VNEAGAGRSRLLFWGDLRSWQNFIDAKRVIERGRLMLRFHLYLELKACLGRRMQKDDADARMGAPTLEIYFLEMPPTSSFRTAIRKLGRKMIIYVEL